MLLTITKFRTFLPEYKRNFILVINVTAKAIAVLNCDRISSINVKVGLNKLWSGNRIRDRFNV